MNDADLIKDHANDLRGLGFAMAADEPGGRERLLTAAEQAGVSVKITEDRRALVARVVEPITVRLAGSVCDDIIESESGKADALSTIRKRLSRLKNVTERGAEVTVRTSDEATELIAIADWVLERCNMHSEGVGAHSQRRAMTRLIQSLERRFGCHQ